MFKIKSKYDNKVYESKFLVISDNAILLIDYSLKITKRLYFSDVEVFKDNHVLSNDELKKDELTIFYESE